MAGAPTPVKPDPAELKKAQDFWTKFTQFSKLGIALIALLLAFLAFTFINWV